MNRRLIAALAAVGAMTLSACDDPRPAEPEVAEVPMEDALPVPGPDAVPVAPPQTTDTPTAADPGVDPAEKQTSEESVKPESETLFY